jgi:hypothetical protein
MTASKTGALWFAFALAACLAAAASVDVAQAGQHDHEQHAQAQAPTPPAAKSDAKPDMMAEMKKADAELKALVNTMNAAKGDAKVEAMAKVINALAARHESMQARMADMRADGSMMGGRGRGMMGGGAAKPDQKAPDQK